MLFDILRIVRSVISSFFHFTLLYKLIHFPPLRCAVVVLKFSNSSHTTCSRTIVSPNFYQYGLLDWSPTFPNSFSGLGRPGDAMDWTDWPFANTGLKEGNRANLKPSRVRFSGFSCPGLIIIVSQSKPCHALTTTNNISSTHFSS